MNFLKMLEGIRTPALDRIFSAVTHLGGETFFLIMVLIIYWCVSKRRGLMMMIAGFFSLCSYQFLKLIMRVPRPWVRDPEFTIVESARADALDYSFPSGHVSNTTTVSAIIALEKRRLPVTVACLAAIALIAFSRMYLGVHTPADVLAGFLMSAVVALAIRRVFIAVEEKPWGVYVLMGVMLALSLALTAYTFLWPFPADTDPVSLAASRSNACSIAGTVLGFLLGYHIDRRHVHFSEKAPIAGQIIKIVLGLGVILGIKSGLNGPLNAALGEELGRCARYFIIALFASGIWPMTFSRICRLTGRGKEPDGSA